MPRCLEVFCGTKSVSKQLGPEWEVVSVDLFAKFEPTICADVHEWDYKAAFPPGHFDYVHLSPPCTEFSRALTTRPRRLEVGDALAEKALEIVEYFQPRWWTLENPATGELPKRPYMEAWKPYMRTVCYCKYNDDGKHPYKKPTAIWTNLRHWEPRPMCNVQTPCADVAERGAHSQVAQLGPSRRGRHSSMNQSKAQLYSIPGALIREWIWQMQCDRLLEMLVGTTWPRVCRRLNIVAPEHRQYNRAGAERRCLVETKSMALSSRNRRCKGIYDLVWQMLPQAYKDAHGEGEYFIATVNKNVQCYPHKDARNVGETVVLFLGDYSGGTLCLEDGRRIDKRRCWHFYRGSELEHWNEPHTGDKYSVIASFNDRPIWWGAAASAEESGQQD